MWGEGVMKKVDDRCSDEFKIRVVSGKMFCDREDGPYSADFEVRI